VCDCKTGPIVHARQMVICELGGWLVGQLDECVTLCGCQGGCMGVCKCAHNLCLQRYMRSAVDNLHNLINIVHITLTEGSSCCRAQCSP